MQNFLVAFLVFHFEIMNIADGSALILPHEIIERCDNFVNHSFSPFDYSAFEIYQENDTHTFINGTVTFNNNFDKIPVEVYTEQKDRGHWHIRILNRKYPDLCRTGKNPLSPAYPMTKNFPSCPFKEGSKWISDMTPIVFPEQVLKKMPHHYMGSWRATALFHFNEDGQNITWCFRAYADVYEDKRSAKEKLATNGVQKSPKKWRIG